ncbi:MAG: glycosyltransferase family 39 protein [Planctomycetota bacterium]|nr:glycosyltransferase family 39 protein [Planctomycetota bacterium]
MSSLAQRILLLLSVACLVATIALRPLWYDEILGHWMATLSWPSEVRAATRAGIDLQPPGWYLLVRATETLTGSLVGPRLLGLVGVATAALLVGRLARERWGREIGHFATLAILLTAAREYAWEGRPYGLVLGFAALALFAWSRIAGDVRRTLWLAVLGLSLAAAVQLHYFAVLLVVPLGVGELVRARSRGRLDWAVLAAFVVPMLPLFAVLHDAREASQLMRIGPFSAPGVSALESHYKGLLSILLGVCIALGLLGLCQRGLAESRTALRAYVRDPLQAVIVAFLLLPALAMLLSIAGGSGLSHPRYALAFTLGASLAAASLLHALGLDPRARQRVAFCCALAVLILSWGDVRLAWRAHTEVEQPILADSQAGTLSVFPFGVEGLQAWQAADESTRSAMLLVADPAMAVARGAKATVDVNLTGARDFFPFPVADWNEVRELNRPFVLVQRNAGSSWLLEAILQDGAVLERVPAAGGWKAWLVRPNRLGERSSASADGQGSPKERAPRVVRQNAPVAQSPLDGG